VPYPRPKGRGSIEAPALLLLLSPRIVYPRPKGRGSIEAQSFLLYSQRIVPLSTSERTWLH